MLPLLEPLKENGPGEQDSHSQVLSAQGYTRKTVMQDVCMHASVYVFVQVYVYACMWYVRMQVWL